MEDAVPSDPFDLERFVTAQDPVIEAVLTELRAAEKRSHWMWFIFPQLRGLGRSPMAQFYGIGSLEEARAYLGHAILGRRLILCTQAVLQAAGRTANQIFGSPDDMKFCSSMTLFGRADWASDSVFHAALARYCGGKEDARTAALLRANGG
jgi:uncharacterized protein (DUF1810 family)